MSTATPTRKPLPGYYQFGAGAFAGVTEICIFYPLDVVKTRMQLDTGKSPSMVTSFKNIIREEGVGRLYRGLVPPLLLEAPKRAVKFASNDFWGKIFIKQSPDGKMTQGLSILTGAAAGATESFVVVPFELVKIRLQDKTSKYAGPMDVVRTILRQHGPLGLYAGMESTFWRHVWWNAGFFGTIHTLRTKLPKAETPQAVLLNNFISGAAGGFVGTALNTPFDVVKSRIQGAHPVPGVVPKYNWTYPSLALILREEGAAALYKGFVPKVLRLAPGGGVLLLVVEAVLGVVRNALGPPMNHRRVLFNTLPPEVIQHIAVAACELTLAGPPNELAMLLPLSQAVHAALSAEHNPGFHARIFSAKFDSRAPTRRFAEAGQPLTARSFANDLPRRWKALKRIRRVSSVGRMVVCSEDHQREDLWLVYLMFLECDGNNWTQLQWARLDGYLRAVLSEELMPSSRPGYMIETTTRALGLWLMWFLTEIFFIVAEVPTETSQMHTILRPWALASHKYDILCAPYTHWLLPVPEEPDLGEDPFFGTHQYVADLDLRNRTEVVTHMGRRIRLAPPRASVAAIMSFMVRLERNGPIPRPAQPGPPIPQPAAQFPSTIRPAHPGLTIYPRTRYPAFLGPGSVEFDGRVNRLGSAIYDSEWRRILQCGNPFANPRFKLMPILRPGDLAGHWEGRFVFLTFDAFRDMLAGVVGAVTSGPLAQQPQVWRIREHHLVHRRRRIPLGRASDVVTGEMLPTGGPLDAYIPRDAQFIHHGEPSEFGTRRLEIRLPDATHPLGYRVYDYTTLDGPTDHPHTYVPTTEVLPFTPPPMNLDELPDWDPPRPPTLGDGDDEFEEEIRDTLITGEGHSSWGVFKLRGRIRAWDGMVILVKDYDGPNTQGRGRWLYKGYVSGGNWVGRWRDTFTSERLSGYEGVFSVTRRY
ncbi:putative mitochondrial 2-oxodicarboxylate carrier [Schizosaccharomyces pombe 972h-] [Rhizoctonia solani]|uniref:Putative mitochondrial 2-oxodicarboxylate carrier [Schizosaccharomyces pombe 972h-] n=1 Tax=Rhizoctonia solani TaxID=456999 RepID=A0A0K6FZZ5_9AGAM|nr:putative mitochondrial 2-oxodicarboxylate carrier [Schizosaccharomyces pombe 972h-] [Rhizoctonia solani]